MQSEILEWITDSEASVTLLEKLSVSEVHMSQLPKYFTDLVLIF